MINPKTILCQCCKTNYVYLGRTYGSPRKYCKNCSRFIDNINRKSYIKGYRKGYDKGFKKAENEFSRCM